MNTGSISTPVRIWTLSSLAVFALVSTVWATAAFWPITFLGHRVDRATGVIFAVDPESPAAQAGVRVDDRIVAIYEVRYGDVVTHWNILRIVGPREMPIPVVVERDGNLITLAMVRTPAAGVLSGDQTRQRTACIHLCPHRLAARGRTTA
ncbi:MAG: hypothetical protein HC828_15085 [Blastochloris sp.]|nr:hypothetical protein [Blastochloris sp.]